ncbi:GmrSD restriction endonuclease domain-containing protein [Vibrio parahaemolyticus]
MKNLTDIFVANPTPVKDLLCDRDMCFYMPSYQRKYSWAQSNIQRLFEDFRVNFHNALTEDDAIVFLGTVLTMKDNNGKQVLPKPADLDNLPTKISLVVDGQQRLTTLLLTLTRFHNVLLGYHRQITHDINEAEENNCASLGKLNRVRSLLDDALASSKLFTTVGSQHPKIIREEEDCWVGRTADGSSFGSPVAEYLHKFGLHTRFHDNDEPYPSFDMDYTAYKDNTTVKNAVKWIDEEIEIIKKGIVSEGIGCITEADLASENLREHLDITAPSNLDDYPELREMVLVCAHFKFIIERVCITFVIVNAESYAFDMFEALNTSGEPLTAYETLRPKIIKHKRELGIASKDIKQLEIIDSLFDEVEEKAKNSKDKSVSDLKHKATTEITRTFAYYHDGAGATINPNLGRQRKYLLNQYDSCENEVEHERYLHAFAIASMLQLDFWANGNTAMFGDIDAEAASAAKHLLNSNHTIVSAAVLYFAQRSQLSLSSECELNEVLKALAAFQGLWRAYTGKTAQIDAVYKDFYQKGCPSVGMSPLNSAHLGKTNAALFKKALQHRLTVLVCGEQIGMFDDCKASWLDVAISINTKQYNKVLPLILAASQHQTSYNPGDRLLEDQSGWSLLDDFSTGHLLKNTVPSILIEDSEQLEYCYSIGNRILASKALNRQLNNSGKDWTKVGAYLRQALDENEQGLHTSACESGQNVSDEMRIQLVDYRVRNSYIEFESLYDNAWSDTAIIERSQGILSNAWEVLNGWIS